MWKKILLGCVVFLIIQIKLSQEFIDEAKTEVKVGKKITQKKFKEIIKNVIKNKILINFKCTIKNFKYFNKNYYKKSFK